MPGQMRTRRGEPPTISEITSENGHIPDTPFETRSIIPIAFKSGIKLNL